MPLNLSPTQLAFNARGDGKFNKPFEEQQAFFRQKENLPTEYWDDILGSAHDRAFIVAGATKADLLNDLRGAVDKAIVDGKSIKWFRQEFDAIVAKHGWQGWTGSDTQAGRDWRVRVIYDTNMRVSYAAGRYAQLTDPVALKARPYWKYIHSDLVSNPRPLHQSWNGTVLRYDHPWWRTHFCPNGFGCRCRIMAVSESEYKGHPAPDDGTYIKKDVYGVEHVLPNGVDYGWDYTPGKRVGDSLRQIVQDKLIRYPEAITRALTKDINKYVNAHSGIEPFVAQALEDKNLKESLWLGFVENPEKIMAASEVDASNYLVLLPSDTVNHVENHHKFDGKGQRPVQASDYLLLQEILRDGEVRKGDISATGQQRVVATLMINGETFRAVFEVRDGKKSRAVVLVALNVRVK